MTRIPGPLAARPARTWSLGSAPWQAIPPASAPRARVIIDNDFSGDPDDLYQLVHHLLSPSVEIVLPPAQAVTASAVVTAIAAAAAAFFHRIIFESSWYGAIPLRIAGRPDRNTNSEYTLGF